MVASHNSNNNVASIAFDNKIMIVTPNSFLIPNDAFVSAAPKLLQPADFLSKYSIVVPTAIASLVAHTNEATPLDASFQPGCYDVVFGRGKGSYNRPGNKHFRALVATYIVDYQQARTKVDKSAVLNGIVDKVRSYVNPETGAPAQFVKYDKSTGWVQIGDDHAREKVGHAIREAMMTKEGGASVKRDQSRSPVPKQRTILAPIISQDELPEFTPSSELFDSVIGLEIDIQEV